MSDRALRLPPKDRRMGKNKDQMEQKKKVTFVDDVLDWATDKSTHCKKKWECKRYRLERGGLRWNVRTYEWI